MKTLHIDLAAHGLEGQWVDVRDPRFLSMRTLTRWQGAAGQAPFDTEGFVRDFVTAWHILDADTDAPMTDPSKDDIGGLSATVFNAMSETMKEHFRGQVAGTGDARPHLSLANGDTGSAPAAG